MDELINETTQAPVRRQRKKRTKFQIFKEAYLPIVIVALAVILVITFIVGSVGRAVDKKKAEKEASIASSESVALQEADWLAEWAAEGLTTQERRRHDEIRHAGAD